MRVPSFERPTPGIVTRRKARELTRAYEVLERLSDPHPSPGLRIEVGSQGTLLAPGPSPYFLGKILGATKNSSGQWAHSWETSQENADGTKQTYSDGMIGDITIWPAYEDNNNLTLPGTFVWMRPGAGEWVEFSLTPPAPPEEDTITIINVSDISNEACVAKPVFNTFDNTLNVCVNGVWFTFCTCSTNSGTGSGTGTGAGCNPGNCINCLNPPYSWTVIVSGFSGIQSVYNQSWVLGNTSACVWSETIVVPDGTAVECSIEITGSQADLIFSSNNGNVPTAKYLFELNPLGGSFDCCAQGMKAQLEDCGSTFIPPGGSCEFCDVTPASWSGDFSGFSGDYNNFNGPVQSYAYSACDWSFLFPGGETGDLAIIPDSLGEHFQLRMYGASGSLLVYTSNDGSLLNRDCCKGVDLQINNSLSTFTSGSYPTLLTLRPLCEGNPCPQYISVTPNCCGTQTGTGTGTGGGGGGGISTDCCPDGIPATLTVTVTGGESGSGVIAWDGVTWTGMITLCGHSTMVQMGCAGGWQITFEPGLDIDACGVPFTSPTGSVVCSPFLAVFNCVGTGGGCCDGVSFTATVTQ